MRPGHAAAFRGAHMGLLPAGRPAPGGVRCASAHDSVGPTQWAIAGDPAQQAVAGGCREAPASDCFAGVPRLELYYTKVQYSAGAGQPGP